MISVIIPVYNAEYFLEKLFESIAAQTLSSNQYEIVFIDNNSTDPSPEMINSFIRENQNLNLRSFTYSDKASSYGARNVGVRRSAGEILVFTDADCILSDRYLENIQQIFSDSPKENLIISGKIDLFFEDKKNVWENFDKIVHMRNDLRASNNKVATANMAIHRTGIETLGLFEEVTSGGDFAFSIKAKNEGFDIQFFPEVLVQHPTRKSYHEIEKKMLRIAKGNGELHQQKSFLKGLLLYALRLVYFPKYLYISYQMIPNVGIIDMIKFNVLLSRIKFKQIGAYVEGHKS